MNYDSVRETNADAPMQALVMVSIRQLFQPGSQSVLDLTGEVNSS